MIITLSKAKTLLQISGSTYDTLINSLIPLVEEVIVDHCNNYFIDDDISLNGIRIPRVYMYNNDLEFVNSTNSIDNSVKDLTSYDFNVGDSIRVFNSKFNNKSFTIDSITTGSIILNDINIVKNESGNTVMVVRLEYPRPLEIVAAQMIKFNMAKITPGMSSEHIDSYSYNLGEITSSGYPKVIMNGLNDYRKLYLERIYENLSTEKIL
jgi:hypothetical protein